MTVKEDCYRIWKTFQEENETLILTEQDKAMRVHVQEWMDDKEEFTQEDGYKLFDILCKYQNYLWRRHTFIEGEWIKTTPNQLN